VPASAIKTICTDGGTEFLNADFRKIVAREDILHQHTARYRSSQNGVAERAIRTGTEMASAMLLESKLPHYLWEDALEHACYIRNRIPKRGTTVTPHERLRKTRSSLANIPVFGQSMVVRQGNPLRRKKIRFDGRGSIGAFAGYTEEAKAFKVYIPEDARPLKATTDVIPLSTMLYDDVLLSGDDEEPPEEGGGDESMRLEDADPNTPSTATTRLRTARSSAAQRSNAIDTTLRDTSWAPDRLEEFNGTSELTKARRSERITARTITAAQELRPQANNR
jgi:hypothetical protein